MVHDFAVGPRRVSRMIRETWGDSGGLGEAAGGEEGGGAGQELAGQGDRFGNGDDLADVGRYRRGRVGERGIGGGRGGGGPVVAGGGGAVVAGPAGRGWRRRRWRRGRRCRGGGRGVRGRGGRRRRGPGCGRRAVPQLRLRPLRALSSAMGVGRRVRPSSPGLPHWWARSRRVAAIWRCAPVQTRAAPTVVMCGRAGPGGAGHTVVRAVGWGLLGCAGNTPRVGGRVRPLATALPGRVLLSPHPEGASVNPADGITWLSFVSDRSSTAGLQGARVGDQKRGPVAAGPRCMFRALVG